MNINDSLAMIRKYTSLVDWSAKEVLVGSVGSVKQFNDNLARNYYYVPERNFDAESLSVRYVALYQSANLFGENAGIQYYGEITQAKRIQRKNIRFPMRRDNGEDWYYAFRIKEWMKLSPPVSVKNEGVFAPKFTNLFLLQHCRQSYELFGIRSEEQYCLMYVLKLILSAPADEVTRVEQIYRAGNGRTVWVRKGCLDVIDENGKSILFSPVKISDAVLHQQSCFNMLVRKIGI